MTLKTTWSISRIDRYKDTGIVYTIEYKVDTADDEKGDAAHRTSAVNLEPPTGTPVAFKDITKDLAIKWVKDTLDAINAKDKSDGPSSKEVEDNLLDTLKARRELNPNNVSGFPWS